MGSHSKIYILIAILVVIAVSVGLGFVYYVKPDSKADLPAEKSSTVETKTYKQLLNTKSENDISAINASTTATRKDLDSTLSFLIIDKALSVKVAKNIYADQTNGYTLIYDYNATPASTTEAFVDIFQKNNFQIIFASRDVFSGYVLTKNQNYRIEVTIDLSKVTIKAQKIIST